MATSYLGGDFAPVTSFPQSIPPMPAVERILARYDRPRLAAFVTIAIDLLDAIDGDADLEATGDDELAGDESDCDFSEDDAAPAFASMDCGPGCEIADPGGCEHDGQEEDDGL